MAGENFSYNEGKNFAKDEGEKFKNKSNESDQEGIDALNNVTYANRFATDYQYLRQGNQVTMPPYVSRNGVVLSYSFQLVENNKLIVACSTNEAGREARRVGPITYTQLYNSRVLNLPELTSVLEKNKRQLNNNTAENTNEKANTESKVSKIFSDAFSSVKSNQSRFINDGVFMVSDFKAELTSKIREQFNAQKLNINTINGFRYFPNEFTIDLGNTRHFFGVRIDQYGLPVVLSTSRAR